MVRACEFCRKRKIRCDSAKPTCSTCRSSNRVCMYHNGPRKQRPSAARIDQLESEKAALEDALVRLKGAGDAERHVMLESVIVRSGRVSLGHQSALPTDYERRMEHQLEDRLLGSGTGGNDTPVLVEDHSNRNADNGLIMRRADEGAVSPNRSNNIHAITHPSLTETSPHASESIFCSTSVVQHSSLRQLANHEQQQASTETLRYQLIANAAMERQREHRLRGLSSIRGVPAELALHLLDLHWSRQHHTFLLTYRPTFMRELEHGGPYCSDLLLFTILACASKFSETPDPETGQRFFARCDDLLLREGLLIQSSIPTVIALVMLGSTFIARGMTSKGWLYTGYAMRMIYDLGLHTESHLEVNKYNIEEIEIRRRVFWGAFVCEKLQSLYLGRPPTIRLQDLDVSQDFLDTFEELEPWEPYDHSMPPGLRAMSSSLPLAYSVTVFQHLCQLSQIMTMIIDKVYGVGATASSTRHEIRPLDDTLAGWYRSLPHHLTYEPWAKSSSDSPDIVAPNRIILLTTYHSLIVLLHRPYITATSPNENGDTGTIGTPAFAWKRCTAAARHITSLVLSYQSIYPLRKSSYLLSYAVYVACTIHVLNTASLAVSGDTSAYTESSTLLSASLKCLDALAVPNSGVADTARIIRRLMAAKGVEEPLVSVVDTQDPTDQHPSQNGLQFPNSSPTYDDVEQMQLFQDIFEPGQDLLFGFMNENISLPMFDFDCALS